MGEFEGTEATNFAPFTNIGIGMGPDIPNSPAKNAPSAQTGTTQSLAANRHSIFQANSTDRPTVVQVGLSANAEADGKSTMSPRKRICSEEPVKIKCNESKKPKKNSHVKTLTKANKVTKKRQKSKASSTTAQSSRNFFDANTPLIRVSLKNHVINPPWPLQRIFDIPAELNKFIEMKTSWKACIRSAQKTSAPVVVSTPTKSKSRQSQNLSRTSSKHYLLEKVSKPFSEDAQRGVIDFKAILKSLIMENIIEPNSNSLWFRHEDHIISSTLLQDGTLWFMDKAFATIPDWMNYVISPVKQLIKYDESCLKRVFFGDFTLYAWSEYRKALMGARSARKRQKLTPLNFEINGAQNVIGSKDIKKKVINEKKNQQKRTIVKLKHKGPRNLKKSKIAQDKVKLQGKRKSKDLDAMEKVEAKMIDQGGKGNKKLKIRAKAKDRPKPQKAVKSIAKSSEPISKSKRRSKSKLKQAERSAHVDPTDTSAKKAQPLKNRILSRHWTQNASGSENCNFIYVKGGKSILQKLSIAALINFNFTAVQPNQNYFPKCYEDDLILSKEEFEKMKSFFLLCDSITKAETNDLGTTELMHESGFHFLSNIALPDKMKPDKLERMSKNLTYPDLDPLMMVTCQNYAGNLNNKDWNRRLHNVSSRQSRASVDTSILYEKQPFKVVILPEALFLGDLHAHLCTDEIIGLLGGRWDSKNKLLIVENVFPCRELTLSPEFDQSVSVEMEPGSASEATNAIQRCGMTVVGWYHSHPLFQPSPSVCDINNQSNYQNMFESTLSENRRSVPPYIGMIFTPYDTFSAKHDESRVNIFHTRAIEVRVDRKSSKKINIPMRLIATPLTYANDDSKIIGGDMIWKVTSRTSPGNNNNNNIGDMDLEPEDCDIGVHNIDIRTLRDILDSMISKVELNFARSKFLSNAKPIEYRGGQDKGGDIVVQEIAASDTEAKKNDAKNSELIKAYTTKYGIPMQSVISQTIQLISYYKVHKKRTKFRKKLQKNKTKKDKLYASVLKHSQRLQIKTKTLKENFAADITEYILSAAGGV